MQPMENWLDSALPVANAVSFEFDDINVTAQHLRWPHARLYDQFIKDYRGSPWYFRRTDVFMRGQVSEKWDIKGS